MRILMILVCLALEAALLLLPPVVTMQTSSAPRGPTKNTSTTLPMDKAPNCRIFPVIESFNETILELLEEAKLIVYTLSFPDYNHEPFDDFVGYYKPDTWYRTTTLHGETLLTFPYNYEKFSLTMLSIGVHKLNVSLADSPANCFGKLPNGSRIRLLRELVINDFSPVRESDRLINVVCNYKMFEGTHGHAEFQPLCCNLNADQELGCDMTLMNKWMKVLLVMLEVFRVLLILYGPLWMFRFIYAGDTNIKYKVSFGKPIEQVLHIEKMKKINTKSLLLKIYRFVIKRLEKGQGDKETSKSSSEKETKKKKVPTATLR